MADDADQESLTSTFLEKLDAWGKSSMPPAALASLITALHFHPFQPLPALILSPALLFSSYINLAGYPTDSAGLSCSASLLYLLVALRRKQKVRAKFFSTRGMVRGAAVGLAGWNAGASGWVYRLGDRREDYEARVERNRWGEYDDKQ